MTSWFWLVGAVVLSLLPPLVKNVLGGNEEVVTALPRGLLDRDRGRLGPRRLASRRPHRAVADAGRRGRARRCSRSISAGPPTARRWRSCQAGVGEVFGSSRGLRVAIDLAGLAIAGGLFIVPAFSAVQAWAGADRRARVVAAVNVLNAAFMVGGTIVVAVLQAFQVSTPASVPADRRRQARRRRR